MIDGIKTLKPFEYFIAIAQMISKIPASSNINHFIFTLHPSIKTLHNLLFLFLYVYARGQFCRLGAAVAKMKNFSNEVHSYQRNNLASHPSLNSFQYKVYNPYRDLAGVIYILYFCRCIILLRSYLPTFLPIFYPN